MIDAAANSTSVVIVGAGPAGLVVGCLLRSAGIDCVVLERRTREHCVTRARAGFLAANSVRILGEHALAAGLTTDGQRHSKCAFRSGGTQFELSYDQLGRGEVHTVYPQQDLVRDLIVDFTRLGGDIHFGVEALRVRDVTSGRPRVECREPDGGLRNWQGRFVAGCDGQHGVSRRALPDGSFRRFDRDHGISWLAILAQAPPSMAAVVYAIHENGFAGHMARSPSVTRYYLQCDRDDDPQAWSDARIWEELSARMRADQLGPLKSGPILERGIVHMSSTVIDPMQHGGLFLAGDAASLISPSAAKGANLAIMEAEVLAGALTAAIRHDDDEPLSRYSSECLPRIWRAQEFSHWMINLLHGPTGSGDDTEFLRSLQQARLRNLQSSRTMQDYFAENYVGI